MCVNDKRESNVFVVQFHKSSFGSKTLMEKFTVINLYTKFVIILTFDAKTMETGAKIKIQKLEK